MVVSGLQAQQEPPSRARSHQLLLLLLATWKSVSFAAKEQQISAAILVVPKRAVCFASANWISISSGANVCEKQFVWFIGWLVWCLAC